MKEDTSLEDLIEQFLDRCRSGDAPDAGSFAAEHPGHSAKLLEILPLMLEMEGLRCEKTQKIFPLSSHAPNLPDSDYKLLRKIGSGGMGVVFEALQISLNRKVAVKLLSSSLLADALQREHFENEARVIAMLHHPNIVKILSAGCSPERCYYAMELIEGKGLDQCSFNDPREIARIGLQAAKALAYAHSCGIMHRDIKPANLLLDANGEVHVSDFGLAFVLRGDNEIVEREGSRSGTLRYMSPERLTDGVNTFSSDQYSLGATLYELITKSPLLPERSPKELMERICREPVPPLQCAEPDLAAIINKSVSYHPGNRYRNMDELAEELQHFLNHEPVHAAAPSPVRRLVLWAKRKPAVAVLAFAALSCAAAFVIALAEGYRRTADALNLAKKNAAVADATLSQVFARVAEQPPSQKNTLLLSALLPYYQMIAGERNLPDSKISEANAILGECALRAGSYALAGEAFRNMMKFRTNAFPLNQLAAALKKQGKEKESTELSRQVAARFSGSEKAEDRFEAVRALLALSGSPESKERSQAFRILEDLLANHADNPDYRFLYAQLLGGNPRLFRNKRIPGVEPNAVILLLQLADAHPERPEYGLALVELMLRKFRYARSFRERERQEAADAVNLSERLLGRWPNDPQIVSAVVQLHRRYLELLRRRGEDAGVRKGTDRLLGILEILFYNPEISDSVKEHLLHLQFRHLDLFRRGNRTEEATLLLEKIKRELDYYHGPELPEFRKKLEAETERKPDAVSNSKYERSR